MSSLKEIQDGYWRSLEQLEDDPRFDRWLEKEFPEQAEVLHNRFDRRRFMQLMGASLAFAGVGGLAGCKRWEEEHIVPMSRRPDDYIPGVPRFFASAMELGGHAIGLLGQSFDGRPTKIEGNPSHPFTGSASTPFAQASVLDLYDPDRSRKIRHEDLPANWSDFETFVDERVGQSTDGSGVFVLSEGTDSPTIHRLRAELQRKMPGLQWVEYEPLSTDNIREGVRQAFGAPGRPIARLDQCKTIVALDDDLFLFNPSALRHGQDFAKVRRPDAEMARLYAVESTFTTTGSVADHRLPLRSELVLPLLQAIDAEISGGDGPGSSFLSEPKVEAFVGAMVEDLQANRGASIVSVGFRQPPEVHALAAKINADLGNLGRTLEYVEDPNPERPSHFEGIRTLVEAMNGGQVQTLFILGGNPVYSAPADLGFAEALGKVEASVHLSSHHDETSAACTWHLPRAHYLETWGDARSWDGTVSIVQPLINPLFGGKSSLDVLALMLGRDLASGQKLVRETFDLVAGLGDKQWRKALHDGYVINSRLPVLRARPQAPDIQLTERQKGATKLANGELEVVFVPSSHAYDGRFANNGWLQETPDFMTKLTWDNAALIGPGTATELGVSQGDMLRVSAGDRQIEVAAYVMPGQAPYSVTLAVGHGRTRAGHVAGLEEGGVEPTGFDVYPLRTASAPYVVGGVRIERTGGSYLLASTQDHWQMDSIGRESINDRLGKLIQHADLEQYQKAAAHGGGHGDASPHHRRQLPSVPSFLHHENAVGHPPLESLWKEWEYEGHRWGMSTDLSNCIGCNACMVACQAENNVPIVGKEQVAVSREMHWLRIDRYFKGDPDDPELTHQPVLCQQCENAPCESVCPVGATLHSDEGLNDMAYNRCVGTRYCLNNCPYRVRRFNFFEWNTGFGEARNKVRKLLFNPEVTVRSRGVMEKCTWCVQRIQNKKIEAKNERRHLRDGEITPACAQACPTQTIVFGDLNDPDSRVSKLHESPRAYALLGDLNTKPRNAFLSRISNPNPALVGNQK